MDGWNVQILSSRKNFRHRTVTALGGLSEGVKRVWYLAGSFSNAPAGIDTKLKCDIRIPRNADRDT